VVWSGNLLDNAQVGMRQLRMTAENLNHVAGALESLATIAALAIGGWWTYRRFVRQREDRPHVAFTVDAAFIAKQGGYWIVELISRLENKGKVRHQITNFTFDVYALFRNDDVIVSDQFGGQAYFPHLVVRGSWLPTSFGYTFIDPGLSTHYSFLARIPEETTMFVMHSRFDYEHDKEFHVAEKTFAVPDTLSGSPTAHESAASRPTG
jgi:hypothetical protein